MDGLAEDGPIRLIFELSGTEETEGEIYRISNIMFKVCKSVHHLTFQINQPTRCNNLSSLLLDVYVQLNMFWLSPGPSSGAQQLQ